MHLVYRTSTGETRALSLEGRTSVRLGREAGLELVLTESVVSRHHATIECVEGFWFLRDHASANGTFLNGLRLSGTSAIMLREGDVVELGSAWLLVSASAEPGAGSKKLENLEGGESAFDPSDLLLDGLGPFRARPEPEQAAWDEVLARLGRERESALGRALGAVAAQTSVEGAALFGASETGLALMSAHPQDAVATRLGPIARRALVSKTARLAAPRGAAEDAIADPNETVRSPRILAQAALPVLAREGGCSLVLAVESLTPRLDRADLALLAVFADRIGRALAPMPQREIS